MKYSIKETNKTMTKEQIFKSDRFFIKVENGEMIKFEMSEEEALEENKKRYLSSASYRNVVAMTLIIKEREKRIQKLEASIKKFLGYTRAGVNANWQVPHRQIEELAEALGE